MSNDPDPRRLGRRPRDHVAPVRHRSKLVLAPLLLVVALAIGWTIFWFQAASVAQSTLAGWQEREEALGRTYRCGTQTVGGYPFRFEVRCADAGADLRTMSPPLTIKAKSLVGVAQIYQPTLLIAEIEAPLTVSSPGSPAAMEAEWTLAQASLRGPPASPERASTAVDNLKLSQTSATGAEAVFAARHVELHARLDPQSSADHPVVDLAVRLEQATAPTTGPLLDQPIDAEVSTVLRGLKDLKPKPLAALLRELQQAGGELQVASARIARGNMLASGTGTLHLSPQGRLDGVIDVAVAGFDPGLLERLVPGLKGNARLVGAGMLALLGRQTQLEGRPALVMPLRFADGAVFLGPVPLGHVAALY